MTRSHDVRNEAHLDDMIGLLKTLQANQDENGRGSIIINELSVKVDYDLYEGHVGPVSFIQAYGDIETSYSKDIENALKNQISKQIKDAMTLLAKLYLLQRLLELGDPEITKIIKSRHYGVQ